MSSLTVVVKDELDPNLDITSIRPMSSSHSYNLTIEERTLVFTFDNILLVDSVTKEPASHGFFSFTVDLKDNLPLGTVIENQAGIYFDFNPPIITNLVVNTISELLTTDDLIPAFESTIYPNPISQEAVLYLNMEHAERVVIKLTDYREAISHSSR